jgi:hypothetical protein
MIIQTILLEPSGAVWTDDAGNVSRLDPSGAVEVDAEHPSRNQKVVGSVSIVERSVGILGHAAALPVAGSRSKALG